MSNFEKMFVVLQIVGLWIDFLVTTGFTSPALSLDQQAKICDSKKVFLKNNNLYPKNFIF